MVLGLQWSGITPLLRHLLLIITSGGDGLFSPDFPFIMEDLTTVVIPGITLTPTIVVGIVVGIVGKCGLSSRDTKKGGLANNA